jgi:hypothetical protein
MRKVFGLTVMLGLMVLSLGRPSSALTSQQEACLRECVGVYHGCSLKCAGSTNPGCQLGCNTENTDCRQSCLS